MASSSLSIYDELIAMDAAYVKGIAVLAAEMGDGKYSKLAIKYFTLMPYMRGGKHWLRAKMIAEEEERLRYCLQQKRIYERPEIQ